MIPNQIPLPVSTLDPAALLWYGFTPERKTPSYASQQLLPVLVPVWGGDALPAPPLCKHTHGNGTRCTLRDCFVNCGSGAAVICTNPEFSSLCLSALAPQGSAKHTSAVTRSTLCPLSCCMHRN